jgi:hypothetical protein
MEYRLKEISMCQILEDYQTPKGYRSCFKGVPFGRYAEVLKYIDFTKYYVMFRGPRNRGASSTRKRDAKAFDVYMRSARDTNILRTEREAFFRGVNWAKDNI